MRSTRCSMRGAALAAALVAGTAGAAERDPLQARFIVDAGTFLLSTDTRVRLDGTLAVGQRGTDINFEQTFGIGDADRFRLDAFWRIHERHALRGRSSRTTAPARARWSGTSPSATSPIP